VLSTYAYVSRYVGSDLEADLKSIQASSQRNNASAGITGALLYDAGRFVQVLEGTDSAIDALLLRLRGDTRHRDFVELLRFRCDSRTFGDWTLHMRRLDRVEPSLDPEGLLRFRDAYLGCFRPDAREFVRLVASFFVVAR
jgi:hypothetical protein